MKSRFGHAIALVSALGLPLAANGFEEIPQESGFSGHITLGVGSLDYESNMVVGTSFFDAADDTINSLSSPSSESTGLPVFSGMINYTFAPSRTQIFVGNALPDYLQFDFATQLGVRKEFGSFGVLGIAYLANSIPAKVWEDPYLVGSKRFKTDRTSNGVSLKWEQILNTRLSLELRARKVDVDDERSGQSITPPLPNPKGSLSREGNQNSVQVQYDFRMGEKHVISPSFRYSDFDLDGNAMKNERYEGQLAYGYFGERYNFVANALYGSASFDNTNPVFGETNDADIYGASATLFYKRPFGLKSWQAFVGLVGYKEHCEISFYNTKATVVSAGGLFRF
jgi:hypothetical protein